jgi:N-acetylmuramoyl-L-alanine amidase
VFPTNFSGMRDTLRTIVKQGPLLFLFSLLILITLSFATAQECHNYVAVDGNVIEGGDYGDYAGRAACYFIAQGNNVDAYIRAPLLAEALELELSWDEGSKTLVFTQGNTTVRLRTTNDIRQGLQRYSDALTVNGTPFSRPVPMGILVDGVSWIAVTPLAEAFGAAVDYDSANKTVFVDSAAKLAELAAAEAELLRQVEEEAARTAAEARAASEAAANAQAAAPPASLTGGVIERPRVGRQDNGVTRVAVDLPPGVNYSVGVKDTTMVIGLPGLQANGYTFSEEDPNVVRVEYGAVDGQLALVVTTRYPLGSNGQGFRVGLLERDGHEVLYIDFSPDTRGQTVVALTALPEVTALAGVSASQAGATTQSLSLPAPGHNPTSPAKVVVIDPGHGGRFGGAQSPDGRLREEILTLEIALRVKALLEAQGVQVIMTRTSNTQLADALPRDLAARAALATIDRNIFVSIHVNSVANREAHGIETYLFGQPIDHATLQAAIRENGGGAIGRAVTEEAVQQANAWASNLLVQETLQFSRSLANYVQSSLISTTGARDRGVKQNAYQVLRQSHIPAILIEVGFITHPSEGPQLATEAYQGKLANAIASGILNFFESNGQLANR